jgi:YVTN family beta-propeller protein
MFVTNTNENTTSVISDRDNSVVAVIPVGFYPTGLAYDSSKNEIFVANSYYSPYVSGSNVSVISDKTNSVVATIPVGTHPEGVAYDSGREAIFVTSSVPSGVVNVISDKVNAVIANVTVGSEPMGIAYDSAKGEVFVANSNYQTDLLSGNIMPSTVSVISDTNNQVVDNVTVGGCAWGVAYDNHKGDIYTTNFAYTSDAVSVISDSSINPALTPTVPELSWLVIVPLLLSVLSVAVILRHRKTAKLKE